MPFDASGNFTRVHNWQQDRDNGIRIMADRHDEEDDNFANAFNQTFLRTGTVPMGGNLNMNGHRILDVDSGTLTNPGITFELDGDTGFYQPGAGQLAVSANGAQTQLWTATSAQFIKGTAALPGIVFIGDPNTGFWQSAADTLDFSTAGVNKLRIGPAADPFVRVLSGRLSVEATSALFAISDTGWVTNPDEKHTAFVADNGSFSVRLYEDDMVAYGSAWGFTRTGKEVLAQSFYTGGIARLSLSDTAVTLGAPLIAPVGTAALPSYTFTGDTNTGMYRAGTDAIGWATAGVEAMRLDSLNRLGVNVVPAVQLHVKGTGDMFRLDTTTARGGGQCFVSFADPSGAKGHVGYAGATDVLYFNNNMPSMGVSIGAGGASKIFATSTGEIGINTITPRSALNVEGKVLGLPIAGADTNAIFISAASGNAYGLAHTITSNGNSNLQAQRFDGATTLYALSLNPLGGNIGIGVETGSPGAKLHVKSAVSEVARLEGPGAGIGPAYAAFYSSSGRLGYVGYGSNNNIYYLANDLNGPIVFYNNGTEKVRIKEDGNVGIGSTNPLEKLHLQETTTAPVVRLDTNSAAIGAKLGEVMFSRGSFKTSIYGQIPVGAAGTNYTDMVIETMAAGTVYETGRFLSTGAVYLGNHSITAGSVDMRVKDAFVGTTTQAGRLYYRTDDGQSRWYSGVTPAAGMRDFSIVNNFQGSVRLVINSTDNSVCPGVTNTQSCGKSGLVWTAVWATNGTIQTSDQRLKEWHGILTPQELSAAKELAANIGIYQWLSDINEHGESAELHVGLIAQTVQDVFIENGLDVEKYGFFQKDEETGFYSLQYSELAMFMLSGQEQRIRALEAMLVP